MDVFIVRPFGPKETRNGREINFDIVEEELIQPVLDQLGLHGGTTGEIARAGNIQADMMERLLVADIVIADISIHNANVFYELGVRHALRHRPTILIRCAGDQVPFDIQTNRFLEYDFECLEESTESLVETLRQTIHDTNSDSPVYQMLPDLQPANPDSFHLVPKGFIDAVEYAEKKCDIPMLALLGSETLRRPWKRSGLRMVGKSLFKCKAWPQAKRIFELVLADLPDDIEANMQLGTVYHRLGDIDRSNISIQRNVENSSLTQDQRAEARALKARNLKTQWVNSWAGSKVKQKSRDALRSGMLLKTAEEYRAAYFEDLNHYYPGINAFSFYTIVHALAKKMPEVWQAKYSDPEAAESALVELKNEIETLSRSVLLSLKVSRTQLNRTGESDVWLEFSDADYRFLTHTKKKHIEYVAQGYADAAENAERFAIEAAARQLTVFLDLGIFSHTARGALEVLGYPNGVRDETLRRAKDRIIISTGHRIDDSDRPEPRFPDEVHEQVGDAIRTKIQEELDLAEGNVRGIAGLASGNDILFHESCKLLDVKTHAILATNRQEYTRKSVAPAGPDWVERFNGLVGDINPQELSDSDKLPDWLGDPPDYSVFQRGNLWILEWAFSHPNTDVTLLAFYDGKSGDGPGGTADMIRSAEERGAKIVRINATEFVETS